MNTETAPTRPWIVWAGLTVVLAAAAVLSFDALRSLALAVSIPETFAWLLPIAVDAGAAVSCAAWLGGQTAPKAARYAGWMTWSLLVVTVAGNAGQLGMHAHKVNPPWWVAVLVGTIPPAVVGATVHLLVLMSRRTGPAPSDPQPADQKWVVAEIETLPDGETFEHLVEAAPAEEPAPKQARRRGASASPAAGVVKPSIEALVAKARPLVAKGIGRPTLAKELSISPTRARELIDLIKSEPVSTSEPGSAINGKAYH